METGIIKWFTAFLIAVVLVCVSYTTGYERASDEHPKVLVDTMVIHDTITQYKAVVEERRVIEKVYLPVTDTIRLRDTLYIEVEREQLVWQDSLSTIYASGFLPQIDSVQHFIAERIVTKELTKVVKKPCRWSIGINAGYGCTIHNGRVLVSPYIGGGISYNIITW